MWIWRERHLKEALSIHPRSLKAEGTGHIFLVSPFKTAMLEALGLQQV